MIQTNSKRGAFLISIATFLLTLVFLHSTHSPSRRSKSEVVGVGDLDPGYGAIPYGSHGGLKTKSHASQSTGEVGINMADPYSSAFVPGHPKPPGSNYTRNLVVAKTKKEDATWVDTEDLGIVNRMIYVVDDKHAPLHPPMNKGHEVMVYLTYIIDHYDNLPDVSIFMHAHKNAWHQNDLLNYDAAEMVKRLSSERVQREGYMNLRCHWMPGCPEWMHPGSLEVDPAKKEEALMAQAWAEIFPDKPMPEVLAQPCCAQFALSRDRIRALSRDRYLFYREWVIRTKIEDKFSGRVWEYLWQVAFTGQARVCPNQWSCYCDGYGMCFKNEDEFDYWFELQYNRRNLQYELKLWNQHADKVEEYRQKGRLEGIEGSDLEIPPAGRNIELRTEIDRLTAIMDDGRQKALERGRDPRFRAMAAGRPWKDGDGY